MVDVNYIAQPAANTTRAEIASMFEGEAAESLDAAAAYITSGGVRDLLLSIMENSAESWTLVTKRWLTSFDYCRSEPVALSALMSLPSSLVRVYDADFCLQNKGLPRTPFHPKAFMVRSPGHDHALAGSGNLSRSGLARGIEAGLRLQIPRTGEANASATASMESLRQWFENLWDQSAPLTDAILTSYEQLFSSTPNLASPTLTEDDLASNDFTRGSLSNGDLLRLRVCRNLWIEAGNITRNRGPHLPGNQLMLKRLSRVFFGFTPEQVPENTTLGAVNIAFGGGTAHGYTLSYSDNKMDKLNLPMPGVDGPAEYDNKNLLFYRITPSLYGLTLGNTSDKAKWFKRSQSVGGAFKMTSGREWGVF